MKVKFSIYITFLIIVFFIIGCTGINNDKIIKEVDMISELSYNNQTNMLSFLITNKSNSTITYGLGFIIEKQIIKEGNVEWIRTNLTDDLMFIEIVVMIDKGKTERDTILLKGLKEPFEESVYRIARIYNTATIPIMGYIQFKADKNQILTDFKYYDDLYKNYSTSKGLELYVWMNNERNIIACGLLDGTNRNKNDEDFKKIRDNPVFVNRMADILATYPKETYVFVKGLEEPLTDEIKEYLKNKFEKLNMQNIVYA